MIKREHIKAFREKVLFWECCLMLTLLWQKCSGKKKLRDKVFGLELSAYKPFFRWASENGNNQCGERKPLWRKFESLVLFTLCRDICFEMLFGWPLLYDNGQKYSLSTCAEVTLFSLTNVIGELCRSLRNGNVTSLQIISRDCTNCIIFCTLNLCMLYSRLRSSITYASGWFIVLQTTTRDFSC